MSKEKTKIEMTDAESIEDAESAFFSSKVESFWSLVFKRFRRHKLAVFGTVCMCLIILSTFIGPMISPYEYDELHIEDAPGGQPARPCLKYWFGTDKIGRDYLTRCLYGGRVSLLVGFAATGVSVVVGTIIGCLAGFYGGILDIVVMRVIEVLSCVPSFFLLIILNTILTESMGSVIFVLALTGWMGSCRQIRAQFMALRNQEFIQAASALGLSDWLIVFRHMLPNAITPVIVGASMSISGNIMAESGLSYLGLGVHEPKPSWGAMLRDSQNYILNAPWLAIFPGLLISMVALSLNFMGDGFRDALDPRSTRR